MLFALVRVAMIISSNTQRGKAQIKRQETFDALRKETKWRMSKALKAREAKITKTLEKLPLKDVIK